ncbi:hypothetical protein ALC57_16294, partial [Trachymyrmex cornetzi]
VVLLVILFNEFPIAPRDVGMLVNTTSKNIPLGLPPAFPMFPFRVATPSCLEGLTHLLLRSSPCYTSRVSAPLVPQEVNLERFSLETANTHIGGCVGDCLMASNDSRSGAVAWRRGTERNSISGSVCRVVTVPRGITA